MDSFRSYLWNGDKVRELIVILTDGAVEGNVRYKSTNSIIICINFILGISYANWCTQLSFKYIAQVC